MSLIGHSARQRAVGAVGGTPAGPAVTTLMAVAARTALAIRGLVIVYVLAQLVIWRDFYAADPWRLAGPVAAISWAVLVMAYLQRRQPGWRFAATDTGVQVVLALTAVGCVPPAMRGDSANWLYITTIGQLVVPAWFAPAVAMPLACASGAAYWTGSILSTGGTGSSSPAAASALLVAAAAVAWWGRRMLFQRASAADRALAQADAESRAQYVLLSRNIERREHERLLHDTVINTLTALARPPIGGAGGGGPGEIVGRCWHDVTLMEHALGDPDGGAGAAGLPDGGLLAGIEAVASEMRARGLAVQVDPGAVPPAGTPVPPPVAAAVVPAVREALMNVAAHAGTATAWVEVTLAAPGEPAGLRVTVRDNGIGFDPARADPARLGLRRSIIERITDCGGTASVRSAPGEGTEVTLCWAAAAEPAVAEPAVAEPAAGGPGTGEPGPGTASGGPDPRPPLESPAAVIRAAYSNELPRVAGTVAGIWQLTLLIQVLVYLRDYRQAAIPVAVWLGMLAAAGWLVPRARAGGLSARQAAFAVAVAVAAVVLVGWDRLHGAAGTVDWSVVGTGWLLALVAISRPVWVWATGALILFAAHAALASRVLGATTPLGLARLASTAYTLLVILAVFAALRPAVSTYARMAGRRAALAGRSAAERAAAVAVHQDRRARLALLELEALPLLRAIADGSVDPAGSDVQSRCARHAATLRQALTCPAPGAGGLLADLAPALAAARQRGVPAEVRVVGDPGHPPPEVAGATLAAVEGVMSSIPPQPVTLTVLAGGEDVELYLTFGQPPRSAPDMTGLRRSVPAAADWRAAVDVDGTGAGFLAVRWRKAVPV
jgi:signal transduction histidine kinase